MYLWDATRCTVAKRLYGRPLRVALAEWILEIDYSMFFLKQAQNAVEQALPGSGSAVGKELDVMVELGMMEKLADGRRVYFIPVRDNPLWVAFEAIVRTLPSSEPVPREPASQD